MDKAGRDYWDNVWEGRDIPVPVDPKSSRLRDYQSRSFHKLFSRVLPQGRNGTHRLLEIGAARSTWLPYFNRQFGFQVAGIDYSEIGCKQANALLQAAGVGGTVICADFFSPPGDLLGAFDVVVSFGVAEHFQDSSAALARFAAFLKPGGLMITSIPNLTGLVGWIQKRLGRRIYDMHVPLDRDDLALAHRRAGLKVRACGYLMSTNFSVLNFTDWPRGIAYTVAVKLESALSMLFWALELRGLRIRPNKFTSPYVVCVASKPGIGARG